MDHFPPDDWIDFARGLLPGPREQAMQAHLEGGCSECLDRSRSWQYIVQFSRRESSYQPPADDVRLVKAAALQFEPGTWMTELAQFARLVFDSVRDPSPAMVRSMGQPVRQLLHEAEPFVIDLRLEADHVRKRTSLLGQILNSRDPDRVLNGVDVVLLSGENLVEKASANPAGEFSLEYGEEKNLQLFINIRGQRAIGLDLPDMRG